MQCVQHPLSQHFVDWNTIRYSLSHFIFPLLTCLIDHSIAMTVGLPKNCQKVAKLLNNKNCCMTTFHLLLLLTYKYLQMGSNVW